jgi:inhibitor of cysteine peptidase
VELGEEANGEQVEVSLGAHLRITLAERPTTGFRWQPMSIGEPALRLTDDTLEPAAGLGGTGARVLQFETAQPGEALVELAYRRAWETNANPARRFSLRVRVVT